MKPGHMLAASPVKPQASAGPVAVFKSTISSLSLTLIMASLVWLLGGCASIKSHHRMGSVAADDIKLPASTAARIALQSTLFATAKAPLVTSKVGARMLYERTYSLLLGNAPVTAMKMTRVEQLPPQAGGDAFESLLDREGFPERSSGSVHFFVDGTSFFPAFNKAVDGAKQRIDVQSYIFDSDHFAVEVAEHLKRKSFDVPVRVYFDSLGSLLAHKKKPPIPSPASFTPPGNLMSYLIEDSRIQVRKTSNPYFVADHTKLHVVDDIAFVGGMNVGVEYRFTWHDMMAQIEGPIVHQLKTIYDDHWEGEEWQRHWGLRGWFQKDPVILPATAGQLNDGQVPLRMLLTDTSLGKREVLKAALAGIRCARHRIWIQTPYFSCDEITVELEKAVKRGVDVRVIIPGATDSKLMNKVNARELSSLLKAGARVYEYPGMTHLKATLCDDWLMFGSANYDTLSMRINRELNLATSDPATVRKVARMVFEKDFRVSSRLSLEEAKGRGGLLTELLGDQL